MSESQADMRLDTVEQIIEAFLAMESTPDGDCGVQTVSEVMRSLS